MMPKNNFKVLFSSSKTFKKKIVMSSYSKKDEISRKHLDNIVNRTFLLKNINCDDVRQLVSFKF